MEPLAESPSVIKIIDSAPLRPFSSSKWNRQSRSFLLCRLAFLARSLASFLMPAISLAFPFGLQDTLEHSFCSFGILVQVDFQLLGNKVAYEILHGWTIRGHIHLNQAWSWSGIQTQAPGHVQRWPLMLADIRGIKIFLEEIPCTAHDTFPECGEVPPLGGVLSVDEGIVFSPYWVPWVMVTSISSPLKWMMG